MVSQVVLAGTRMAKAVVTRAARLSTARRIHCGSARLAPRERALYLARLCSRFRAGPPRLILPDLVLSTSCATANHAASPSAAAHLSKSESASTFAGCCGWTRAWTSPFAGTHPGLWGNPLVTKRNARSKRRLLSLRYSDTSAQRNASRRPGRLAAGVGLAAVHPDRRFRAVSCHRRER